MRRYTLRKSQDGQSLIQKNEHSKLTTGGKQIGSMTDVHKAYRKQQIYKKKLKGTLQRNQVLDDRIRTYESQIKDLRTVITFQMKQLTKHMGQKLKQFTDESLQTTLFESENKAHETVKRMMTKYEEVEKETKMVRKSESVLKNIQQAYRKHACDMRSLLLDSQRNDRQYRQRMDKVMTQKTEQIEQKRKNTSKTMDSTRQAIQFIEWFQNEKNRLEKQERQLREKLNCDLLALNAKARQTEQTMKMTQVIIEQSNRQEMYEKMLKRTQQLQELRKNNDKLEIHLRQLDCQNSIQEKIFKKSVNKTFKTGFYN